MQAHPLSLHAPSAPGVRSKGQNIFSLKVVMLHIKLKEMGQRALCKHIFCPYIHPLAPGGPKDKKNTLNCGSG